jgi:hypothetical protein
MEERCDELKAELLRLEARLQLALDQLNEAAKEIDRLKAVRGMKYLTSQSRWG